MEFLHNPARILNNIEEFIEDAHFGLILIAEIKVKQSILNKLIDQKNLKMRLLFFLL